MFKAENNFHLINFIEVLKNAMCWHLIVNLCPSFMFSSKEITMKTGSTLKKNFSFCLEKAISLHPVFKTR